MNTRLFMIWLLDQCHRHVLSRDASPTSSFTRIPVRIKPERTPPQMDPAER